MFQKVKNVVPPIAFESFGVACHLAMYHVAGEAFPREIICLFFGYTPRDTASLPVVRMQSACITSETFGSHLCDCAAQLEYSVRFFKEHQPGILLYLPWQEGRGAGLVQKLRRLSARSTRSMGTAHPNSLSDTRTYSEAVSVLRYLKVEELRLMTNNPARVSALTAAGLNIVERIPCLLESADPEIRSYIEKNRGALGHLK